MHAEGQGWVVVDIGYAQRRDILLAHLQHGGHEIVDDIAHLQARHGELLALDLPFLALGILHKLVGAHLLDGAVGFDDAHAERHAAHVVADAVGVVFLKGLVVELREPIQRLLVVDDNHAALDVVVGELAYAVERKVDGVAAQPFALVDGYLVVGGEDYRRLLLHGWRTSVIVKLRQAGFLPYLLAHGGGIGAIVFLVEGQHVERAAHDNE